MNSAIKSVTGADASGYLVAKILRGTWRKDPPRMDIDADALKRILPLLTAGGVSGLVWRRIRETSLAASEAGQHLHEIYRYIALRNAVHAHQLKETMSILSAKGIESVLVKGWSLCPVYPEPGLRLFGDIDLCLRPGDFSAAAKAIREEGGGLLDVDLHYGFGKFYETRTGELFRRSELHDLEGTPVRILKFEDHFRFLCLHLMRHGGNRPLWLCDIAAAVEAIPTGFDWDLCLGDEPRHAELVVGAIEIARDLLDASMEKVPAAARARSLPRWLIPTVVSEWGAPFALPTPVTNHLRNPFEFLRELPRHWPNAIEATINLGGRLNDRPRWPLQIADVAAKAWGLLTGSRGLTRAAI